MTAQRYKTTIPPELANCLKDPNWRIENLYKILIKGDDEASDGLVMQFKPNKAQRRFIKRLWHRNLILKARQLGFCLDPSTRVLTADLEWKRIGDIQPGEEVVACDEHGAGGKGQARRMRTAGVVAVRKMQAERFRITFDDGRSVVCTDRHPWLSRKAGTESKWRSLSGEGNEVVGRLKVGTEVRWITKPWDAPTFEDGWMGGMLDGEGSMAKDCNGAGVNVSQRPGPVWDRLVRYASERGYNAKVEADGATRDSKHGTTPVPKLAFNRMDEIFRLIGQTRPTRFIGRRWWEGKEFPGKRDSGTGWATITSIESLGMGEVVDMQTTTGTYIAEGFVSHNTTLVAILWLDHALFNANTRCGIIAQDREAAEVIFRDKVKFAYENLPDVLKKAMPLARDSATELLFAHNNSSIRVATSMRSGTIHRLHISEYGKICAKFPDKAKEVQTGSIPAVPKSGILVIESTAEGREGEFYEITKRAQASNESGHVLSPRDYRFHFYPWWMEPNYRLPVGSTLITDKDREYFLKVEAECDTELDDEQRAWYVATRNADFSGNDERMWQEFPSTPGEPFMVSTEGTYYATQLAAARKDGRITRVPYMPGVPVDTFWDIGLNDQNFIWFHQKVGLRHHFIKAYGNVGEAPNHYVAEIQKTGWVFGKHYLPHDGNARRIQQNSTKTYAEMLEELGLRNVVIVDRIQDKLVGIQMVRNVFPACWFDEAGCSPGLIGLENYRKEWNTRLGVWSDYPRHDAASDPADAFRQFAQGYEDIHSTQARPISWRSRLASRVKNQGSAQSA